MGRGEDGDELRISADMLKFLFEPLREVLKDQGQAVIELSDQMKVLVTLVTAHPTRLTLSELIITHDKQAIAIKEAIAANTAKMEKFMLLNRVVWAVIGILMVWFHWGPKP